MITYEKRGVRIRETWFGESLDRSGADLIFACQYPHPLPGAVCRPKHTLCNDLTRSPETLFATLNKGCRNEVRRGHKDDQTQSQGLPAENAGVRAQFVSVYSEFAHAKGLPQLDNRRFNLLADAGCLDLSVARDTLGKVLAYHAHLLMAPRARLLYSVSLFRGITDNHRRNVVGRANRLLHWEDMVRFHRSGYALYDWGGWCVDETNTARQRINRFKAEFGGSALQEWDCFLPLTIKGRIALWIYRRFRRNE